MTSRELTQRGVDAYNGQQFARASCLFLMALIADREAAPPEVLDGIKATDLVFKKETA